ncbi:glycosyl transferase family 2 [Burkholderia ubonensis]|nr:glycosyl transferase family 2 [Burkholderia ubonensis]KVQ69462.1 glycosyl transferase family 2 [Burkholderia ubonensis]KVT99434.1 glycosyl transferase family 2 [Burkholderia ubonensis]
METSRCEGTAPNGGRPYVTVSIVLYFPREDLLDATVRTLVTALRALGHARQEADAGTFAVIYLIDNGGAETLEVIARRYSESGVRFEIIRGHGNVGYGRGHNLAIARSSARYHLVLNPDVETAADALTSACGFLDAHDEVGLLVPDTWDEHDRQYLCRRYPSVADLLLRGFAPRALKQFFVQRLARYEMRDLIDGTQVVWDPPIVSGCFMLFRTSVLRRLKGFDQRYFLYFEDYDLSMRTARLARIVFLPQSRIMHHGGGAARKGWRHIKMFAVSAVRFFGRFGWRLI